MKVLFEVSYKYKGKVKTIYFGNPDTEKELEDMYDLRSRVYKSRGYFDTTKRVSEKDEADEPGKSIYCIAKLDEEVVGAARLIKAHPLDTEKIFKDLESFDLPKDPNKKIEFSRLVVLPYEERKDIVFPRSFIFLFIMYTAALSADKAGVAGGLGHIKKSLQKKLEKINVPIKFLDYSKVEYPADGVIAPYYHKKESDIHPFVFHTEEFLGFYENFFKKNLLYKRKSKKKFVLRSLNAVRFLRFLKIV